MAVDSRRRQRDPSSSRRMLRWRLAACILEVLWSIMIRVRQCLRVNVLIVLIVENGDLNGSPLSRLVSESWIRVWRSVRLICEDVQRAKTYPLPYACRAQLLLPFYPVLVDRSCLLSLLCRRVMKEVVRGIIQSATKRGTRRLPRTR